MDQATKAARHHRRTLYGRGITPGLGCTKRNVWRMHPLRFIELPRTIAVFFTKRESPLHTARKSRRTAPLNIIRWNLELASRAADTAGVDFRQIRDWDASRDADWDGG